jgi:hypothetical protein
MPSSPQNRHATAIHAALNLVQIFQAEALWGAVESARALVSSLQEWDLEVAWRHVTSMVGDYAAVSARSRDCSALGGNFMALTAALHSIRAERLAQFEATGHN